MQGSFSFHIFPVKSQIGACSEMCFPFWICAGYPAEALVIPLFREETALERTLLNAAGSKSFSILSPPTHTKREENKKNSSRIYFCSYKQEKYRFLFFPCIKILCLCSISGWYWSPCFWFRWSTTSLYKWMFYVPQPWRVLWFSRTVELLLEICLGFSKTTGNLFLTVNLPFPHC